MLIRSETLVASVLNPDSSDNDDAENEQESNSIEQNGGKSEISEVVLDQTIKQQVLTTELPLEDLDKTPKIIIQNDDQKPTLSQKQHKFTEL